jgi:hypothetical protein
MTRTTMYVAALGLGASLLLLHPAEVEAQQQGQQATTKRQPAGRRAARPTAGGEDGATAPAPTIADLDEIVPRLQSTDPDQVREAIDLLSVIDRREVIPPLAALLRSGQPDPITDRALEALRGLADPSSIEVLTEFSRHRRSGARRRAYQAIAAIEDRRVTPLLEQGLRDSDRTVRANCALALGTIGSRSSLDILFRAFERGVVEAAVSIGKLGNEASVERFSAHLGQQPLSVMLSGYEQYLRRADIDERTKVGIVNRLGEVSGRAVREFLAVYLATLPQGARRPPPRRAAAGAEERQSIRDVVQATIRRIPVEGDTRRTGAAGAPASSAPAAPAGAGSAATGSAATGSAATGSAATGSGGAQ